jgi:acyl dehydratase
VNAPGPLKIVGLAGFKALAGSTLGVSGWHLVTQDEIDGFARVTGDEYWLHTDPERAAAGEFGGTIAHGFFTLSLAPLLIAEIWDLEGLKVSVNYGLNRVRFTGPMPVGERVRLKVDLTSVDDAGDGGATLTMALTFEREGVEKPVCVAEWLNRMWF